MASFANDPLLSTFLTEFPTTPLQVSFEFFPPKTEKMEAQLWSCIDRLAPLNPKFVSVTYGAGGSTRERTHNTVTRIQGEKGLKAAAHLTCVNATREEVDAVAQAYWDAGVRHIVALRGDPPEGEDSYTPTPGGYAFAEDLVAGLKKVADFEISVAAYPEVHPEATDAETDLDNLKRKIDAGASQAITQFFFDPVHFIRFRDRAAAAGISVPIIPGLLPVSNFKTVTRFAKDCGAAIPEWMSTLFTGLEDDPETRRLIAATVAAKQVAQLAAEGVDEVHFYTLNRAELTFAICWILGMRPEVQDS